MAIVYGTSNGETLNASDGVTNIADTIYGYGGNDWIYGLGGNDLIIGGSGADHLNGGDGFDAAFYTDATIGVSVSLASGQGAGSTAEGDILISIENLYGSAHNDTLAGNSGNNSLSGMQGWDLLKGGGGDDVLSGGADGDTLIGGAGADTMYGGDGIDMLSYVGSNAGVNIYLNYSSASGGHAEGDTFSGIEDVTGSAHGDNLFGDNGVNMLDGDGGGDLLKGFGGGDDLYGDDGDDAIYGMDGNDALHGDDGIDYLNGGTGNDHIVGGDEGDEIYGMEDDDTIHGDAGADYLYGGSGDDYIVGGNGVDTLAGGTGNDHMLVDDPNDVVIEAVGEGVLDQVSTSVSFILPTGAEIETLYFYPASTADVDLTGNEFDNFIYGSNGNNVIDGGGGQDFLFGRDGDDTYYVSNNDQVHESGGEGFDTVLASTSFTLYGAADVEVLRTTDDNGTAAINLTGNSSGNEITGNNGDNVLRGGGGSDQLFGRGGNDSYYVDSLSDQIGEFGGQGIDTVYAAASYVLTEGADVEYLRVDPTLPIAPIDLTGNSSGNVVVGNYGNNVINGGDGDDELTGGGGQDSFLFNTALDAATNLDVITDFDVDDDMIMLDDAIFAALPTGGLTGDRFVIGTAAQDANDNIIFNSATGALFYDADGTGAAAAIQFATLTPGLPLTNANFLVV